MYSVGDKVVHPMHGAGTIEEIKENHTIITIAHRLNTIENADCIYVVDNGVIAESGTHDELIAGNGIYKRLYDTKEEVSHE